MTSIDVAQYYTNLAQTKSADMADKDKVLEIVGDICTRVARLPDVSHIEPSFLAETLRINNECE